MGKWFEVRQRAHAAVDEGMTPALSLRVVQGRQDALLNSGSLRRSEGAPRRSGTLR